jgi:hypothetical protein
MPAAPCTSRPERRQRRGTHRASPESAERPRAESSRTAFDARQRACRARCGARAATSACTHCACRCARERPRSAHRANRGGSESGDDQRVAELVADRVKVPARVHFHVALIDHDAVRLRLPDDLLLLLIIQVDVVRILAPRFQESLIPGLRTHPLVDLIDRGFSRLPVAELWLLRRVH